MAEIDLYVNSEDSTGAWDTIGSPPYLSSQDQPSNYIEDNDRNNVSGVFSFESSEDLGTITKVELYIYAYGTNSSDFTTYINASNTGLGPQGGGSWNWVGVNVTSIISTWAQINAATMYFNRSNNTNWTGVDAAYLKVTYSAADLSIDVNDSISSLSSIGREMPLPGVSEFNLISLSELLKLLLKYAPNLSNSVSIAELLQMKMNIGLNVLDSISLDDVIDVDKDKLDLDMSVFDDISVSDLIDVYIILRSNISSSISLNELVKLALQFSLTSTESITIGEFIHMILEIKSSVSDSISLDEFISMDKDQLDLDTSIYDSISVSDAMSIYMALKSNISSSSSLVESLNVFLQMSSSVSGSLSVDEFVKIVLNLDSSISDSISLEEAVSFLLSITEISVDGLVSVLDTVEAQISDGSSGAPSMSIEDVTNIIESLVLQLPISIDIYSAVNVIEQALVELLIFSDISDSILIDELMNVSMAALGVSVGIYDTINIDEYVLMELLLRSSVDNFINVVDDALLYFSLPGLSLTDPVLVSDDIVASITIPLHGVLTGLVTIKIPKMEFLCSNG